MWVGDVATALAWQPPGGYATGIDMGDVPLDFMSIG
jgi:hypothetical protein